MASPLTVSERDGLIRLISAHALDLRRMGVHSLALFGSVARGDATTESDVDVLVDLPPMSLFSMIRIEHYLTDLLGRKVDLVPRDSVRPELKPGIEAEALHVL